MVGGEAQQADSAESECGSSSSSRTVSFATCSVCQRAYPGAAALGKHLETHLPAYVPEDGEEAEVLECDVCGEQFPNPEALVLHLWTHARLREEEGESEDTVKDGGKDAVKDGGKDGGHDSDDEAATCDLCGEEFPNADALVLHLWKHARESDGGGGGGDGGEDGEDRGGGQGGGGNGADGDNEDAYSEDADSEDAVDEGAVDAPGAPQAGADGADTAKPLRYACKRCGKTYSSKMSLYCHRKAHDLHPCDLCDRSFKGRTGLKIHRRKSHSIGPAGATSGATSGATLSAEKAAAAPEITDSSSDYFKCHECLKKFKNQAWLTRHKSQGQCDSSGEHKSQCGSPGKPKSQYGSPGKPTPRLAVHRGVLIPPRFKCPPSKKKSADRPYRCSFCPWSFKAVNHLKEHLLVHLGIKPFPCLTCDRKFRSKRDMKKHFQICNLKKVI
ncbi:zinc finger protein 771-like [Thrips palmi]|uniref:Zinc finger protein 771-like n=1 Tax=Thrips palmi TaxID=161013 RepID=A0A6P8YV56_THRPL|nr:zinc finger protein 771-like [Thrips palmi]